MASTLISLLHTLQASFAGYNLYLASISIRNLQKYESTAQKAAKWSNIAEDQLWKTRYTQASGTVAVLFSFLSSAYLILSSKGTLKSLAVASVNVAALAAAWQHVGNFWKRKAKIPLPKTGEYNEAIGKTQEVHLNMTYLMGSWIALGVLGLVM
ncbi:uncharacterized protein LY89DRAFT_628037 [Mollisia scopiformis]|uniref:DUF1772-domain-containing protein n=1 Tax=Mollisia scopiformis TaxID=149040 RepID=A0A132BBH0_MOLSC|nr:uncharacterized protein LY89DRAFT_628037 [Mollisia scopiformis]KUJ09772.1 hypothetical protein LY89DRAFT_628037 [Mollisia scopiformis]